MWRTIIRFLSLAKRPVLFGAVLAVLLISPPPQPTSATVTNSVESLDTTGDVGEWTSLALDSSGFPIIAYYDRTNGDLKVVHCNDEDCSGGDESITSPDPTDDDVGRYASMVLDGSGYPVVSYWNATSDDLKVMHCNDADCSGGDESITSPDTSGFGVGLHTSIVLDGSGNPVVAYDNGDLHILHCGNANCTSGNSITTPDPGIGITDTSLTLDGSGNPVIAYHDDTNDDLRVLHCDDANCAGSETAITVESSGDTGDSNSIVLDSSGNPVISYRDFTDTELKVVHCGSPDCSSGNTTNTPDTTNSSHTSIALDADGNPVVSYYRASVGDLAVLHCNDANCAAGGDTIALPDDASPNVGAHTSLVLDPDLKPIVSYRDDNNDDLKLVHCGNSTCVINTPSFAVDTTADTVDASPGDGACADASSDCSLRAAIQESNALLGKQFVSVPLGTYTLTISGASEDASATGDLDITDDLSLFGPGGATPTINATGLGDRVLHIQNDASVHIAGLAFAFGVTPSGQDAGGIFIDSANVTIASSVIAGNTATAGDAGGIGNLSGQLTLEFSAVINNHADGSAGGVGTGGGGFTRIRATTISGNSADESAGGIGQEGSSTSTLLNNVTVGENVADADADTVGLGGGIGHDGLGTVTMSNSLVARNTAFTDPDCAGPITSAGYNLLGEDSTFCTFTSTTGDQVGPSGSPIDPLYGGLRDNGGWTSTHAISVESPAIDAGNPAAPGAIPACVDTDQRFVAVPLDGDSDGTARCDIGAYERQGAAEEPCSPPPGGACDTYDFHAEFDTDVDGIGIVACVADGHLRSERDDTTGAVTDVEITYLDGYVDCPGDFFLGSSIPNEGTLTEQVNNDPAVLEFPLDGEFTICVTVASLLSFGDLHSCPDSIDPQDKVPLEFSCKIIFSLSSFDCDISTAEFYDDSDTLRATVQAEADAVSLTLISSIGGVAELSEPAGKALEGEDPRIPSAAGLTGIAVAAMGAIAVLGGAWWAMKRGRSLQQGNKSGD